MFVLKILDYISIMGLFFFMSAMDSPDAGMPVVIVGMLVCIAYIAFYHTQVTTYED